MSNYIYKSVLILFFEFIDLINPVGLGVFTGREIKMRFD
ncbi:TPA: hypothetical protein GRR46_16340 [Vibrio parahaemolyticus]|nr:hypothetical protein [Vibrio parahaemolyticus]EGQ8961165.1 hypothetical protein [Vibrio parahaemolyticus]EGR3233101.1 hypothetical protein [Vibrio parahaemolyticus]HAS6474821.1 hypothetical protein [Vibrio parahaemolyticus]HAS6592809.1 hypothetical protein [Vibrio parahaemolyticus]